MKGDFMSKSNSLNPVYAINRINGVISPGTIFIPADEQDDADLRRLEAVRDLSEAELALFDRQQAAGGGQVAAKNAKPVGDSDDGLVLKHLGFGKYQINDAEGNRAAPAEGEDPYADKAAAQAALDALRAKQSADALGLG
jgi:hypothetical protein